MELAGVRSDVELARGQEPVIGYECFQYQRGSVRYVGILRDLPPQAEGEVLSWHGHQFRHASTDSETVTVHLPEARETYDVRAGEYLGRVADVPLTLAPGEARLLALLPYRVTGLAVSSVRTAYHPGDEIRYRTTVAVDRGEPGDHVLRLDVYCPDGNPVRHYSNNVLAAGGRYDGAIPLALNDKAGVWRLQVTDVTTNASASTTVDVTVPDRAE
jgi:hypothetical protein